VINAFITILKRPHDNGGQGQWSLSDSPLGRDLVWSILVDHPNHSACRDRGRHNHRSPL
jgi:hypothetical protein